MAIEFECPECEATIRVKESAAGKTGRCPKCRVLLMVPDPADWEDEEEDVESGGVGEGETGRGERDGGAIDSATEAEPESEPPVIDHVPDVAAEQAADSDSVPPMIEPTVAEPVVEDVPVEPAAVAPERDSDTVVAKSSGEASEGGTDAPPPATEILVAESSDPAEGGFIPMETRADAMLRKRSRRRQQRMSTKQRVSIATALGGILLVLGAAWWLYASSLPNLTGPIAGERLARLTLEEVTTPIPADGVSDEVINKVMGSFGSEGFSLKSEYISVVIYGEGDQLAISIEPGPAAVPVRVRLGENPDVTEAIQGVDKVIALKKRDELTSARSRMFQEYLAYLEEGSSMNLGEYRDQVALNAAVGTIGYAVEAIVQATPFPCVYEDAEGYCYFFLPKGTKTFQLRGCKLLGENEEAPLPVDFKVTLTEVSEPVTAGQTPVKEEEGTSETDAKTEDEEEPKTDDAKADKEDKEETAKEDAPMEEMKGEEEKPAGEMEESSE